MCLVMCILFFREVKIFCRRPAGHEGRLGWSQIGFASDRDAATVLLLGGAKVRAPWGGTTCLTLLV